MKCLVMSQCYQWVIAGEMNWFSFIWVFSELKARVRELEHENADIRFLNNQYVHKVRAIEKESKTKTDKILQLQEKNFHAVVQTPGGNFFWFSYF